MVYVCEFCKEEFKSAVKFGSHVLNCSKKYKKQADNSAETPGLAQPLNPLPAEPVSFDNTLDRLQQKLDKMVSIKLMSDFLKTGEIPNPNKEAEKTPDILEEFNKMEKLKSDMLKRERETEQEIIKQVRGELQEEGSSTEDKFINMILSKIQSAPQGFKDKLNTVESSQVSDATLNMIISKIPKPFIKQIKSGKLDKQKIKEAIATQGVALNDELFDRFYKKVKEK